MRAVNLHERFDIDGRVVRTLLVREAKQEIVQQLVAVVAYHQVNGEIDNVLLVDTRIDGNEDVRRFTWHRVFISTTSQGSWQGS